MTTAIASTGGVKLFRLSPEITLRNIAPHREPLPDRFRSELVTGKKERTREIDRDHGLAGAILHFESPRNGRAVLVQPAKDLCLRRLAACSEVFRRWIARASLVLADAQMEMRTVEADRQIAVEQIDLAGRPGTGQFIGRTL